MLVCRRDAVVEHVGAHNLEYAPGRCVALALPWRLGVELLIAFLLIGKAAQKPAADAGHLGRIQEDILFLGHAYGNRRKLVQVAAAAAHAAAVAHSPCHLRLVPDAYLAELDAHPVLMDKVLDQLPEINARIGRKVEDNLAAVIIYFHVHKLHVQAALRNLLLPERAGLPGKLVVGPYLLIIGFTCGTHDNRQDFTGALGGCFKRS